MEFDSSFAGNTFVDVLGKRKEEVIINNDGFGEFFCAAGSVSVWIVKVQ